MLQHRRTPLKIKYRLSKIFLNQQDSRVIFPEPTGFASNFLQEYISPCWLGQ